MKWIAISIVALTLSMANCNGDDHENHDGDHGHSDADKSVVKPYPFNTCVVSGEELSSMGDPHVFTHNGQEIKMCCKGCVKKFNADPDKFLKVIADGKGPTDNAHDHKKHDH